MYEYVCASSVHLCVYLSVCLSVSLSISVSILVYLSVYPSSSVCVCPCVCTSVSPLSLPNPHTPVCVCVFVSQEPGMLDSVNVCRSSEALSSLILLLKKQVKSVNQKPYACTLLSYEKQKGNVQNGVMSRIISIPFRETHHTRASTDSSTQSPGALRRKMRLYTAVKALAHSMQIGHFYTQWA